MDSRNVEAVEISMELILNVYPNNTIAPTMIASVKPPGKAFRRMLLIKWPFIIFVSGICDKRNAGTPIVNMLMSVS